MRPSPIFALLLFAGAATAGETTLFNPIRRDYRDELVRLALPAPEPAGTFIVQENGSEIPYQVEEIDGRKHIWICSDFAPGVKKKYEVQAGKPRPTGARVILRKEGDCYLLDNGKIAVKVPAEVGAVATIAPGPITAARLPDGQWIGKSAWKTERALKRFAVTIVGDGTLFGKIRLRYDFEGPAGLENDIPAFAEIEVTLGPGWQHVEIFERHQMGRADGWELAASAGWKPTAGLARTFGGGLGGQHHNPIRPLKPVDHQAYCSDRYITLRPRWNQNYADGWAFCATDDSRQVGAVAVRASRWDWPHQNCLEAIIRESGDYAGIRGSTCKGQRLWWLITSAEPADVKYVARYAWEHLDKLNHEMILDWPGSEGTFTGLNLYDNLTVNPTSVIRQFNRRALADAGKPGTYGTLALQQIIMHSDSYGSYWQHWSPCNPNFFTDFFTRGIVLTSHLKQHPRYEELRKAAVLKLREDLYHSVTLPGGAGQECPGYMAIEKWKELAAVCKEHLGTDDPFLWERIRAAEQFRKRISQPDGNRRRRLPIGDTHNAREGGPVVEDVPADEVARWTTAELPGFGVIFNSRPGTPQETYLAFKSGPNGGHYHGDQLAFHYCANGRPVAVDHHCSYHPRAGQDHMHNRLAFFTTDLPHANLGGYERLIAFKTSPEVDIAVGQVESRLLTSAEPYPPEKWRQQFPVHELARPLVYRRTAVLVKHPPQSSRPDYFVFRDQFWAPEVVGTAFCLHVLNDQTIAVRAATGAAKGSTEFSDMDQDFSKLAIPAGSRLLIFRQGYKNGEERPEMYEIRSVAGSSLTLTGKPPAGKGLSYAVLRNLVRCDSNTFDLGQLTLFCATRSELQVKTHPWFHENGGLEQSQGLRLQSRGRQGEFITVMYPGRLPATIAIPGGVKVEEDEIIFSGDQPTAGDAAPHVTVRRKGKPLLELLGKEIDLNRFQGEVGLCMPDASNPHGDVPDWLIKQRSKRPDWAK